MKTSAKIVAAFLALVLGLCTMPAQAATLPPNFDTSALTDLQNELNGFGTDHAKQISNALLDKAGVEQDGSAYTKKVTLFGKETTIFFMYGHKKNAPSEAVSVVAVMVPVDLTTKALFGDSAPGIGLKNPVLCYAKEDCDLLTGDMPARTQPSLKNIMPNNVVAAKGLNFFGTLTSSIEGFPYALPSELFAGFATGKNEKGQKKYTINAAIIKPWDNPLGLQSTTLKGGMFRLRKEGEVKTTEVWGTASVGSPKEYTLYYKQEGALQQSLAFDTNEAELKDFFSILDALGMPFESAKKTLPLSIVQLSNPNYQPKVDASAPLDFATMMFKATRTAAGVFTELIANADGALLKQKMASLSLNASAARKSVEGRGGVNAKLGPLDAASANFHLDAALTGVPTMGITVKSGVLGNLELAASGNGLKLDVPADCPLRPIGFTAEITDLSLADFPITPDLKDCYSKEIGKILTGAADIASDVTTTVANGAAETAKGLADEAKKNYERLQGERVAAFGRSMAKHATAKDAVNAASSAYNGASAAVQTCANIIGGLDKDIKKLANEIDELLQKLWALVSGDVKSKKKQKAQKESDRDKQRIAKLAAEQRAIQAKEGLDKANAGMAGVPGPNLDADVARYNDQVLGELAQQEVQKQVAQYAATELAGKLKNQEDRKKMLQALKSDEFLAEQEAAIKATYQNLSTLITKGQDGKMPMERLLNEAKTALAVKAVSKDVEAKTEELLRQAVPTLPTMAFGTPVRIVSGIGDKTRCLTRVSGEPYRTPDFFELKQCTTQNDQLFVFQSDGKVISLGKCLGWNTQFRGRSSGRPTGTLSYAQDASSCASFFHDPLGGVIRFQDGNEPNCLSGGAGVDLGDSAHAFRADRYPPAPCGDTWRLVADTPAGGTQVKRAAAQGEKTDGQEKTNLAPLRLK